MNDRQEYWRERIEVLIDDMLMEVSFEKLEEHLLRLVKFELIDVDNWELYKEDFSYMLEE